MTKNLLKAAVVALGVMMGGSAWAKDINPTTDVCARLKYTSGSQTPWSWDKVTIGTTKDCQTPYEATSTETVFEVKSSARLMAVQEFVIPNYSKTGATFTLTLTKTTDSGQGGSLTVWNFTEKTTPTSSTTASSFVTDVDAVTGGTLSDLSKAYGSSYLATATCSNSKWVFSISKSALGTITPDANDNATIKILVTSNSANNSSAGKYQNKESENKPVLAVPYKVNLSDGNTSSTDYDDFATAYTNASGTTNIITLYDDMTVSSQRIEIAKALTIQGVNNQVTIYRDKSLDALTLLGKGTSTKFELTLKNLVFDGQSVSRTKDAIECGQNCTLNLDGVKFQNYEYGTDNVDVKNSGVIINLKNTNTFQKGISLNKNKNFDVENATLGDNQVISIKVASDFGENDVVVKNSTDLKHFALVDATKELTVNGSNLVLSTTRTSESRTTAVGNYGTICLPYDATSENVVLMRCAGIKSDNSAIVFDYVNEQGEISATATEQTATNATVKAGVPYLYRATGDVKFTCTGTTYTEPTTEKNFTGVYTAGNVPEGKYFLYSKNDNTGKGDDKIHQAGSDITISAYKCYFTALPSAQAAKAGVTFGLFSDITGLNQIDFNNVKATEGKFIQNGKLVIVKNGKQYNAAGAQIK